MEKNGKSGAGFNAFMDVAALVIVVGLIGLAIWHTTQYMGLIFEESGANPRGWSRDLAAAIVQVVLIVSIIKIVEQRGTGPGGSSDPDGKKVPEADGSKGEN